MLGCRISVLVVLRRGTRHQVEYRQAVFRPCVRLPSVDQDGLPLVRDLRLGELPPKVALVVRERLLEREQDLQDRLPE